MKPKTTSFLTIATLLAPAFAYSDKAKPKANGAIAVAQARALANPKIKKEKVPFLGVYAVPLNPAVAKQLKLDDGLYLSLEQAIPDSPAAKAGLEQYDVLLRFDDQILVNSQQLQALVRSKKQGDWVTVSILRGGEEKTIKVQLGEQQVTDVVARRPVPVNPRFGLGGQGFPFGPDAGASGGDDLGDNLNLRFGLGDDVRNQIQRQLRRHRQQLGKHGIDPGVDFTDPELLEKYDADNDGKLSPMERDKARSEGTIPNLEFDFDLNLDLGVPNVADLLRDARRRGTANAWSSVSGSAQTKVVTMDDTGSYEFSSNDGEKRFKATSPDGNVLFDGPVNTKEEKAKMPESLRQRLNSIESNVKVRIGSGNDDVDAPRVQPRERKKKGKGKKDQLL